MVERIELTADGGVLILSGENWASLRLVTEQGELFLGADTRDTIVARLEAALRLKAIDNPVGEVEGVQVAWVLSLSEQHSSIYLGEREHERVLFVQDGDGNTMATLTLSPNQRSEWQKLLGAKYS